jgi:hypothetical protein
MKPNREKIQVLIIVLIAAAFFGALSWNGGFEARAFFAFWFAAFAATFLGVAALRSSRKK